MYFFLNDQIIFGYFSYDDHEFILFKQTIPIILSWFIYFGFSLFLTFRDPHLRNFEDPDYTFLIIF